MLKKVKDWLGIEGVKVELDIPEEFKLKDGEIEGGIRISSQSDQIVESALLTFKEKYKRGRRDSKLIDEYDIGHAELIIGKMIGSEEVLELPFILPFTPLKSPMDKWGEKNILFRGLASIAKLAKNAQSSYELVVELTVKGNRLKPYDKQEIVAT